MIVVKAQVTFQELLKYTLYKYYRYGGRILLQVFIFLSLLAWLFEEVSLMHLDTRLRLFSLMGIIYFYLLMPLLLYLRARRAYKSNPELHHPFDIVFDETHIKATSFSQVHTHTWDVIYKIKETPSWFIIYFSRLTATLIPKKDFTSPEQIQALKELIASKKEIKQSLLKTK